MKPKICIVASNFYPKISKKLIQAAVTRFKKAKFFKLHIVIAPGTFEIPIIVSKLIKKYDAFVVLGCVIRGQTSHFDYLCSSVFKSIINLSVTSKIPITNGILTCNNMKQAIKRADPKRGNKGGYAAEAAITVLNLIKQ